MNQIQEKLFQLLIEVDEICKKNDISYYLAAGGALGAVRNGGFLPWDDDLDLYITRDNWNKLVKVMETIELPANRDFVHIENTDLYCNPIGRYVDKDSTLMMKSQLLCARCCGFVVEFFIMDPMPKGEKEKLRHRKYMKIYTELLSPYFVLNKHAETINKDFSFRTYNVYYYLSKLVGKEFALKRVYNKFATTDEKDSDAYCMRWGQRTVMFSKDSLGTPKDIMFENRTFPTVEKPEKVFRTGYGDDWMYVPEIEDQSGHDLDSDVNEPFKTYVDLYMPLIDEKELFSAYKARKRSNIKCFRKEEKALKELAEEYANTVAYDLKSSSSEEAYLMDLLNNRNYKELNEKLNRFYLIQNQHFIKNNKVAIPMSETYWYIAIMNLIIQGSYYKASKLVGYMKEAGYKFSDMIYDAIDMIDFCRKVSICIFDEHDEEEATRLLNENKQYKDIIDYAKAELWLKYMQAKENQEYKELVEMAENAIATYGKDGEIIRYEAYGLHKLGHQEQAKEKYKEAILNTRNAFVWKEAKELYELDAYSVDVAED